MGETCQYHEECTRRIASLETEVEGLTAWVDKLEKKIDSNHREVMAAILELRKEMHQAQGAGWMLIKVGMGLSGFAAFLYTVYKLAGGK